MSFYVLTCLTCITHLSFAQILYVNVNKRIHVSYMCMAKTPYPTTAIPQLTVHRMPSVTIGTWCGPHARFGAQDSNKPCLRQLTSHTPLLNSHPELSSDACHYVARCSSSGMRLAAACRSALPPRFTCKVPRCESLWRLWHALRRSAAPQRKPGPEQPRLYHGVHSALQERHEPGGSGSGLGLSLGLGLD